MASYSPVFSAAFVIYTDGAPNTQFDVPAGFTAVVRDVEATTELGASAFSAYFGDSLIAPGVVFAYLTTEGALQSVHWEGRVVVPGGGFIGLGQYTLGVGATAYIGGYLLRNVAA